MFALKLLHLCGVYAGTLCLIFALTPAPVGQPRQIFAAQLWNMLVGLVLRQIPTGPQAIPTTQDFMNWNSDSFGMPLIWKQALAVAFGVAGQAKLGILHPPATGLSYIFVDKYSWATIATAYLLDVIVVALSILILNLSEAKQYPLFWFGFEWRNTGRNWNWRLKSRRKRVQWEDTPMNGDDSNV